MVMSLPGDLVNAGDLDTYQGGDAEMFVRQAQAKVRSYCGWHIAPEVTSTLRLDGSGTNTLLLPTMHLADLTSITNDDSEINLDSVDWSENGTLRLRTGRWSCRLGGVTVTFVHGFETVPEDVAAVVLAVAARASDAPSARSREQSGQVSVQFGGGPPLLQSEKDELAPYRIER